MIGYLTIDTNNLIDRMSAYTYAYADKYDKLTDDIFNCLKSHIKKGNDFIVYMNKKEDMIKAYAKANIVEAKEVVRRVNKGYDREVTSSNPGRCNFSWNINQLFRILLILSTYQS